MVKIPRLTTVDFETLPIRDRPDYPPPAVGVAIKAWGKRGRYLSWGHPTGNNCTWGEARATLAEAYACPDGVLFHNANFDLDVAEAEFGLAPPAWDRVHDTLFLLFLDDPHSVSLSLKPAAKKLLGLAPEERDAVVEWLLARQPLKSAGTWLTAGANGGHYAGVYVSLTPGKTIAGPYAVGDVDRTEALFRHLYPRVVERGMLGAYDRERRLAPILLEMERRGIEVDTRRLSSDVAHYRDVQRRLDDWLRRRLGGDETLNLDAPEQVAKALVAAGLANSEALGVTDGGKLQSNKDALARAVTDPQLLAALRWRSALDTSVGTFMEPWLRQARHGNRIYTRWNQVRSAHGRETSGTRTGRLSATWFMNMPKEFSPFWRHEESDPKKARALPRCPLADLPRSPVCRSYVVPGKGNALIDRDYSQQEPRILGHFEDGALMRAYQANPWTDLHDSAQAKLRAVGLHYDRKAVKNTNLGLIYGMGVGKLAEKNGMTVEEAKSLKDAILQLYPGLKQLYQEMKRRAARNEPIRTWGGREYYCEPPKLVQGQWRKFDYKLVNVLIQGSAADCTKEAIIRLHDRMVESQSPASWRLILNVHDQLTMVVPARDRHKAMALLQEVMESVEFDVPMKSEGSWSLKSWADLEDYDKKGKRV